MQNINITNSHNQIMNSQNAEISNDNYILFGEKGVERTFVPQNDQTKQYNKKLNYGYGNQFQNYYNSKISTNKKQNAINNNKFIKINNFQDNDDNRRAVTMYNPKKEDFQKYFNNNNDNIINKKSNQNQNINLKNSNIKQNNTLYQSNKGSKIAPNININNNNIQQNISQNNSKIFKKNISVNIDINQSEEYATINPTNETAKVNENPFINQNMQSNCIIKSNNMIQNNQINNQSQIININDLNPSTKQTINKNKNKNNLNKSQNNNSNDNNNNNNNNNSNDNNNNNNDNNNIEKKNNNNNQQLYFSSEPKFQNLNMNFSNNFIPKNFTSSLNSQSNNLIPPPTNIINTFNQNNNVNNQNSQEKRLNINNYYYIGNYIYNQYNRIPGYNEDYNNPNKPRTITAQDLITTTTANNKKIKRIDPNSYINESYQYLAHNIFLLSKDQAGCRFLQKKIEEEPQIATMHFYPAILPYISSLVKDPFGNYLIQKLCTNLKPEQIKEILIIISQNVLEIGCNSHGTRVIQNLINYLSTQDLINTFFKMIEPYIIPLLKELNGTHIIQKYINDFPQYSPLINNIVIDNCISLATHRHGCCVLQKYLDNVNEDFKKRLVKILIDNTLVLVIDQFGNYVIQSIFQLKNVNDSNLIVEKLAENAPYYSKHKYSSNVVEKCFDACDENHRKIMVRELSGKEIMNDLILDEHGNYVIQKVISCAEKNIQNKMIDNLIEIIPKLKNVSFGERILNRLSMIYPKLNNALNNNGNNNVNSNNNKKSGKGRYNRKKYEPLNINFNANQGKNQKYNNNNNNNK